MNIEVFIDKHIRADVTALVTLHTAAHGKALELGGTAKHWKKGYAVIELTGKAAALSAPALDYEAAARAAGVELIESETGYAPDMKGVRHRFENSREEAYRAACRYEGIAPHEIPIIGHYIVTAELADKLEARGERVERDFGGNIVWARKLPQVETTDRVRCNHCMTEQDEKNVRCEECTRSTGLMQPFISQRLDRDPVLLAIIEAEGV